MAFFYVHYIFDISDSYFTNVRFRSIGLQIPFMRDLYRTVGKRRMSQFIEDLLRPHVVGEPAEFGKNRTLRFSGHP
ncbi:hypothetical protein CU078_27500 (plasmid) [Escherichia coli]|nr:hypothetical protein CU078_27500 [Escherichia coli]